MYKNNQVQVKLSEVTSIEQTYTLELNTTKYVNPQIKRLGFVTENVFLAKTIVYYLISLGTVVNEILPKK